MADKDLASLGWKELLMEGRLPSKLIPRARALRAIYRRLPADPRCRICNAPFAGGGARLLLVLTRSKPSSFSMQLCSNCEYLARTEKTGADVDLALVFADIRGSTQIADEISVVAYSGLIDRFYTAATDVLVENEAIIEKLVGDQVAAIFVPGLAGEDYTQRAVDSAVELQRAFGADSPEGAWVPVGIGVHSGHAFVGIVGTTGGMTELTVLGDAPNITARLAGSAASGEILVSDAALSAARQVTPDEMRTLEVKGKTEPIVVGVLGHGVRSD